MGLGLPGRKKETPKQEIKAAVPKPMVDVQEASEVPEFEDEPTTPKTDEQDEQEPTEEPELTEEVVRNTLANLQYRIARIEHHLRLDY